MTPGSRPGAVVAARLSILAAECADPERFGRGRRYFKEQAVLPIRVEQGVVHGQVQGSEPVPYEVVLRWKPVHRPGPVPTRDELSVSCTCPDAAPVCKHVVGVLLRTADEVGREPGLLDTWRGPESSWAQLPIRAQLSVVPTEAEPGPGRRDRVPERRPAPEPDLLEPFFGTRATLWSGWDVDDDDPFPDIVTLPGGDRPTTADPLEATAAAILDEAMAVLASLFA